MMKKNVASQIIGVQMITAADGTAFTGATTISVTGDGGTQATGSVGSGACTHEGNGFHTYAPAQAETNYDHIGFTFTGTGAIPVTLQVYTTFPQTGDSFARIGSAGAGLTGITGAQLAADQAVDATKFGGAPVTATTSVTFPAASTVATTGGAVASVTGAVGSVTGSVGSVTGAVGSVTGAVGSVTGSVGSVTAGVTLANGAVTNASLAGNMEIVFETDFATNYDTVNNVWITPTVAQIQSGLATPTNITAGTITTVSGNVDGSVGSVTGAVGSVTGAVGSVTAEVTADAVKFGGAPVTATTGVTFPASSTVATTTGAVGSVTGAVGSVTGSVGSVTGAVGSVTAEVSADAVKFGGAPVTATTSVTFPAASTVATTTGAVGSVSGAVGSVTGAVGSVTGAVGSVAGNVDGNVTGSVGSNLELGPAEVNAEMVDVMKTDTITQSSICPQEAPPVNATIEEAIGYLYKAWRNKSTQTATTYSLFADDGTTVDQKATVSDNTTTATKGEVATGP